MTRSLLRALSAASAAITAPAMAQEPHDHQAPPPSQPAPHEGHQGHGAIPAAPMKEAHGMAGALGPHPAGREASGTAWQADVSDHGGLHKSAGRWMLMGHAMLNGVYDWQSGPRGDDKAFVSGMLMGSARHDFADGSVLQFRAGFSPDPLMGKRGYPLLLAAGETANGVDTLVDRQHPHDFFMELSASYSVRLGAKSGLFVYGGLPGEPAFGPPAFMHRLSAMDSPEAPITHHWLDSTHIVFGVLTGGLVLDRVKLEVSRFRGREPDQRRWNIETGPLDSTSVRLSWNPTAELSLQASYADVKSPEQLEPEEDQKKYSASAIYTRRIGEEGWWSTTFAWGRRSGGHDRLDAFALESAVRLRDWTIFGRAERIETNELTSVGGHHGPVYTVGKASVGAVRDFIVVDNVRLGIGALYAFNFVGRGLEPLYDGDPRGAMTFVRLKIG